MPAGQERAGQEWTDRGGCRPTHPEVSRRRPTYAPEASSAARASPRRPGLRPASRPEPAGPEFLAVGQEPRRGRRHRGHLLRRYGTTADFPWQQIGQIHHTAQGNRLLVGVPTSPASSTSAASTRNARTSCSSGSRSWPRSSALPPAGVAPQRFTGQRATGHPVQYCCSLPMDRYMQSEFSSSCSTASRLRLVSRSITSSGG